MSDDITRRLIDLEDAVRRLSDAPRDRQQYQLASIPAYANIRIPSGQQYIVYGEYTIQTGATVWIEGDLVIL